MRFPYVQERSKFLPIISMQIKSKVKVDWITFDAFVDSGASYSIFKAEIGDILGLEMEKGNKILITVGDGSLIVVYIHRLIIQIGDEEFEAEIGFSKQLGIGFNIIGRKDIFERFKVCFDEKEKVVEFI
ncbi:MAG: hypothetical protein K8R25_02375 [Methanosarcinales archaeon]|jgi:hypothetical protein|nr:hypothetical protein [Methanosarcinales archaeon]